jgi:hypothetical protein
MGEGRRSPLHLQAESLGLMTDWLEHYRQQAEQRFRRLDAVLAAMSEDERTGPPTTTPSSKGKRR